jgi:hypothetical protein
MPPARPAPKKIPLTLPGDTKGDLRALRDRLVAEIERSEGSAVAALAKQLADTLKALAAMPNEREKSTVDDLSKRRAARRKNATASKPAAKRVKRRSGGGRASS